MASISIHPSTQNAQKLPPISIVLCPIRPSKYAANMADNSESSEENNSDHPPPHPSTTFPNVSAEGARTARVNTREDLLMSLSESAPDECLENYEEQNKCFEATMLVFASLVFATCLIQSMATSSYLIVRVAALPCALCLAIYGYHWVYWFSDGLTRRRRAYFDVKKVLDRPNMHTDRELFRSPPQSSYTPRSSSFTSIEEAEEDNNANRTSDKTIETKEDSSANRTSDKTIETNEDSSANRTSDKTMSSSSDKTMSSSSDREEGQPKTPSPDDEEADERQLKKEPSSPPPILNVEAGEQQQYEVTLAELNNGRDGRNFDYGTSLALGLVATVLVTSANEFLSGLLRATGPG